MVHYTDLDKQKFSAYICKYFPTHYFFLIYVLGAQKNHLIETVLLNTHNICFGWEIRKLFFRYAPLTKVIFLNGVNTGRGLGMNK